MPAFRLSWHASENDSHGELHDTRVAGGRDVSRRGAGIDPRCVELNGVVHTAVLGVIEGVIRFRPELAVQPLPDPEVLENRRVPVIAPGSADGVLRHVTDVVDGEWRASAGRTCAFAVLQGFGKRRDVEPLVKSAVAAREIRIAHHDGPGAVSAASEVDGGVGAHAHRHGRSRDEAGNVGDLPAVEHCLDHGIG